VFQLHPVIQVLCDVLSSYSITCHWIRCDSVAKPYLSSSVLYQLPKLWFNSSVVLEWKLQSALS